MTDKANEKVKSKTNKEAATQRNAEAHPAKKIRGAPQGRHRSELIGCDMAAQKINRDIR